MKKTGFTLVETLVAVTILVIGVIGPLSLASRGISDGLFAQNQLTANLLAQEAMETIINYRNTNVVNILAKGDAFAGLWSDTVPRIDGEIKTVSIDPVAGSVNLNDPNCDASGCKLYYDTSSHLYRTVTDDQVGLFKRQISISNQSPALKVVVTISWQNKSVLKTFSISEYLYGK